jgi:hypothetical protein
MSFKKGKKLLARADPVQRRRWIRHVRPLMKRAWRSDKRLLVFIDEAHIHCDCDLGFGWSKRGGRLWVHSKSPGLSQRVSFFGVYVWSESDVHLEPGNRSGPYTAAGKSEGRTAGFRTAAMQSATKPSSRRPCRRSEPRTVSNRSMKRAPATLSLP